MPELRHNVLTGERVIVAPERGGRPGYARPRRKRPAEPDFDPACPFCPGNEKDTPEAIYQEPGAGPSAGWTVRAFPNKYPALAPDAAAGPASKDSPLRSCSAATGLHEVIVETPIHNKSFAAFSEGELADAMRAYRARFAAAAADERIEHVVIFRNQGPMANASQPHPHAQLAGLTFLPWLIEKKLQRSAEYAAGEPQRSLLIDMADDEVRCGERLVFATEAFAAFVPYAATYAYELWVTPRLMPSRFDRVEDDQLLQFGRTLQRVLAIQAAALDEPDYNLILHTPPLVDGAEGAGLPWYAQIIPRLTLTAGFEFGVGVQINDFAPEDAAAALRSAA